MDLYCGTSGFGYEEWKGSFYPDDLSSQGMLAYYSERLSAVEINNTFYRLPRAGVLEKWSEQVSTGFRFVLKASRQITHFRRLAGVEEITEYLFETAGTLGDRLGAVLFQLPPNFKRDDARLKSFLELLPAKYRCAFEFRHESWRCDAVHQMLHDANAALCLTESEEQPLDLVSVSNWGYVRCRGSAYDRADLVRLVESVRSQDWREVFVFFRHEDEGEGPRLALELTDLFKHSAAD